MMQDNLELILAEKYLQTTNVNIFLTGKAGTGKTTFLKSLEGRLSKRYVVLAPTGVAALQAGGVTLHSFFQLPLSPYFPGAKLEKNKFTKQKLNLIRSLDLIVIDEISMVRCDILDEIDYILRRIRYNSFDKPFGGVQLLMIGDINQLPPVTTKEDDIILKQYYSGYYFFFSHALQKTNYITINLKKIYRQQDEKFIQILNAVRNNQIDFSIIDSLNKRYVPNIANKIPKGYIVLCTHNIQADEINNNKLSMLKGKGKTYKAEVTGDFSKKDFPNNENLILKIGAQVMFLKNDYDSLRHGKMRYYNGKIGKIKELEEDYVVIHCDEDEEDICLTRYVWENTKYSLNKKDKSIEAVVLGTYKQLPLRLAWAVTIHKSQGLTFDKVVIDANRAFSFGQVYVALSRCRSLGGIILTEHFKKESVFSDKSIAEFSKYTENNPPTNDTLHIAQDEFLVSCIKEIFSFEDLNVVVKHLSALVQSSIINVFPKLGKRLLTSINEYRNNVEIVSKNFLNFIDKTQNQNLDFKDKYDVILKRSLKGKDFFLDKIDKLNDLIISLVGIELDNSDDDSDLEEIISTLSFQKELKHRILKAFDEHFNIESYLKKKNYWIAQGFDLKLDSIIPTKQDNASLGKDKKTTKHGDEQDIKDKDLFEKLRSWRKAKADELSIPAYVILSQKALINIANHKPKTEQALLSIFGVGKNTIERYSKEILEIVCS